MKKEKKIVREEKNEILEKSKYHKFLWYTIIFSLLGLIIELTVCEIQKEMFKESFGCILGPLCIFYGIGSSIILISLEKLKGHKIKLFIYGGLIGSLVEYLISFMLEAILGINLWNLEWSNFKLNKRICLEHILTFGILTILLIEVLKKHIDKLIYKIKGKTRKIADIILPIVLILYIMFIIWGITTYKIRAIETLNGKNYTSNNNVIEKFQNRVFSNEIMEKLFKNLEIHDNEGNTILVTKINE